MPAIEMSGYQDGDNMAYDPSDANYLGDPSEDTNCCCWFTQGKSCMNGFCVPGCCDRDQGFCWCCIKCSADFMGTLMFFSLILSVVGGILGMSFMSAALPLFGAKLIGIIDAITGGTGASLPLDESLITNFVTTFGGFAGMAILGLMVLGPLILGLTYWGLCCCIRCKIEKQGEKMGCCGCSWGTWILLIVLIFAVVIPLVTIALLTVELVMFNGLFDLLAAVGPLIGGGGSLDIMGIITVVTNNLMALLSPGTNTCDSTTGLFGLTQLPCEVFQVSEVLSEPIFSTIQQALRDAGDLTATIESCQDIEEYENPLTNQAPDWTDYGLPAEFPDFPIRMDEYGAPYNSTQQDDLVAACEGGFYISLSLGLVGNFIAFLIGLWTLLVGFAACCTFCKNQQKDFSV